MVSACEAHENFYPIVSRTLKICVKNQQFTAIISQFWCMFGYATIITSCFGLNPTIFAMPINIEPENLGGGGASAPKAPLVSTPM